MIRPAGVHRGAASADERLQLRLVPLSPADRAPFLAATRRSRAFHHPWVHPPTTAAAFERFARELDETRHRLLLWGRAPVAHTDVLVGYFSLGEIVRGALSSAYLGYWGVVPHVGQGYMAEGMRLLLAHAFRRVRLHRVEANIQPQNGPSIALARRSGFRKEGFSPRYLKIAGQWRDHERWAMTVEDWRDLPPSPGPGPRRP